MYWYSCVTDAATAELVQAIHKCDLSQAYRVIDQLEKLEESQRVFNLQLMVDYYGEVRPQEKEPAKDEKINEFRYACHNYITTAESFAESSTCTSIKSDIMYNMYFILYRLKVAIERQCSPNENAIDVIIKAKEDYTIEQLVNPVSKLYL